MYTFYFCREKIDLCDNHQIIQWIDDCINPKCSIIMYENDRMKNSKFFKKKIGSYRIIIEEHKTDYQGDKIIIYVIIKVLKKEDDLYKQFTKEPWRWGYEGNNELSLKEIDKYKLVSIKMIEDETKSRLKQTIPEKYVIYKTKESFYEPLTIFESNRWVDCSNTKEFKGNWNSIRIAITNIIDNKSVSDYKEIVIPMKDESELSLFYIYELGDLRIIFNKFSCQKALLLFKFEFKPFNTEERLLEEIKRDIIDTYQRRKIDYKDSDEETLIKSLTIRGYYDWITVDESYEQNNIWYQLENDKYSNLAFSDEERTILESFDLPFFINGQAGSGKSTILYHTFAHYIYAIRKNSVDTRVLFLTYSDRLKSSTQKAIQDILTKNSNYNIILSDQELDEIVYSFSDFLIQHLNDDLKLKFYLNKVGKIKKNYISFDTFKRLFNNQEESKSLRQYNFRGITGKFTAEYVWYVIRSFIKGYSEDSFLSYEKYKKIPFDDRQVSEEDYIHIYRTFWTNWYKNFNSNGLWDDLDLVRDFIKEKNSNQLIKEPSFSVIFCDEAQDYTQLELKLILSFSEFNQYLPEENLILPIAFGGDPFQSINPTGFSWQRVRSFFFKAFNSAGFRVRLENKELYNNYRSYESIVKLANLIQAFRALYLSQDIEKPQVFWNYNGSRPGLYIIDDTISSDYLVKNAKNTIFLIPSANIEEFVENDSVLKRFYKKEDKEGDFNYKNIFDIFSFKGLEQDKIILYKFGDFFKDYDIESIKNTNSDDPKYFVFNYCLNLLYVAITRAIKVLTIVDSKEGFDKFWHIFINPHFNFNEFYEIDEEKVNNWKNIEVNDLFYKPDSMISITTDLFNTNPEDTAEYLERIGLQSHDYNKLLRASEFYMEANNYEKSKLCKAKAKELKEEYESAGDIYLSINHKDEAIELFWKACAWQKVIDNVSSQSSSRKYMIYSIIANFLMDVEQTVFFEKIYQNLEAIKSLINYFEESWQKFVFKLISFIQSNNYLIDNNKVSIIRIIEFIDTKKIGQLVDKIIEIYFSLEVYDKVITLYDTSSKSQQLQDIYFRAKAQNEQRIEEKMKYLNRTLNGDQEIHKIWNNVKDEKLKTKIVDDTEIRNILSIVLKNKGDVKEYIEFRLLFPLESNWYDFNLFLYEMLPESLFNELLDGIFNFYNINDLFEEAIHLFSLLVMREPSIKNKIGSKLVNSVFITEDDITKKISRLLEISNGAYNRKLNSLRSQKNYLKDVKNIQSSIFIKLRKLILSLERMPEFINAEFKSIFEKEIEEVAENISKATFSETDFNYLTVERKREYMSKIFPSYYLTTDQKVRTLEIIINEFEKTSNIKVWEIWDFEEIIEEIVKFNIDDFVSKDFDRLLIFNAHVKIALKSKNSLKIKNTYDALISKGQLRVDEVMELNALYLRCLRDIMNNTSDEKVKEEIGNLIINYETKSINSKVEIPIQILGYHKLKLLNYEKHSRKIKGDIDGLSFTFINNSKFCGALISKEDEGITIKIDLNSQTVSDYHIFRDNRYIFSDLNMEIELWGRGIQVTIDKERFRAIYTSSE